MMAGPLIPILMGASIGLQLLGSQRGADAAEQMGRMNAQTIWMQTLHDIELLTEEVQATYSAQRASFGASGLRVGTGSPLLVQAETLRRGARDISFIGQIGAYRARLAEYEGEVTAQGASIAGYSAIASTATMFALA
jgi:hypothetical protein